MEVDMTNEKNGEDREQGFVVKDRRFSAKKDEADSEPREEVPREEPQTKEERADQDIPSRTFSSLLALRSLFNWVRSKTR
jgi:hypothetical protein